MSATPIVSNPVAIFLIVLVIILLAPVVLNRLKIPHIIGMIVAGVIVGPYGFNILADDSSFDIFGEVGLLYLMFLAGIEIDMFHLRLNLRKGLIFGLLTLILPMVIGIVGSVVLLKIDWLTATLLGSMYAAHTLISYPVANRFGVTRAPSVMISIVGTIIAVIGALLVLGATVNIQHLGYFDLGEIAWLLGKLAIYCAVILAVYPRIARFFLRRYSDPVLQYVFILALVFLSALLAGFIGLEAVLGSFFAGLVLNRFVPASSPLMSRIEFVGNALFIPYFLIGVGMMIDVRVISNINTLYAASIMLGLALFGKWAAAFVAQKIYGMTGADRRMMFGLTTAHTAVALAVVTIGYNLMLPDGSHLLDETILNGTVLVILITCAIAPIVTSGAAVKIKMKMLEGSLDEPNLKHNSVNNILVGIANPITAAPLIELALLMKPTTSAFRGDMYALNVRNDHSNSAKAASRNALRLAADAASAADRNLIAIERFDLNTVTGIINTVEERDISEVYIGMHRKSTVIDTFFGSKIDQLLKHTNKMVVISRCFIPANTIARIVVYVPPKAQFETGFSRWLRRLGYLASELGCRIIFCCQEQVQPLIRTVYYREHFSIRCEFRELESGDDYLLLTNRIRPDDLFVVISARAASVSYSSDIAEMPTFLSNHFSGHNLVVIYPEQFGDETAIESFVDPLAVDVNTRTIPLYVRLRAWWKGKRSSVRSSRNLDI